MTHRSDADAIRRASCTSYILRRTTCNCDFSEKNLLNIKFIVRFSQQQHCSLVHYTASAQAPRTRHGHSHRILIGLPPPVPVKPTGMLRSSAHFFVCLWLTQLWPAHAACTTTQAAEQQQRVPISLLAFAGAKRRRRAAITAAGRTRGRCRRRCPHAAAAVPRTGHFWHC